MKSPLLKAIRVQVVDDHALVRFGVQCVLESQPDIKVVVESDCGECAADDYMRHKPDIVVMDLNMPGMSGTEAMRHILARDPQAKIVVLSIYDTPAMVFRAMESHAMAYVSKGCDPKLLIKAVRQAARGKKYIEPGLSSRMREKDISDISEPLRTLTRREFEIFMMLVDGESARDIAKALHLSPNTVHNHQNRIMQKLNTHNKAELVHTALQAGLLNE